MSKDNFIRIVSIIEESEDIEFSATTWIRFMNILVVSLFEIV